MVIRSPDRSIEGASTSASQPEACVFEDSEGYWTFYPLIGTLVEAQALRVFELSVFAACLPSLLFGRVLLAAVDSIGRQLHGFCVGVFAVVITPLLLSYADAAHSVRQAPIWSTMHR